MLRRIAGENFVGVPAADFGQMRRQHGARLDDRVAVHLGLRRQRRVDPLRVGAERRVLRRDAVDLAGGHARVDRQQLRRFELALRDRHVGDLDAILRSRRAACCRGCGPWA